MKLPVAIPVLLLAASTALPALAATHPLAPVEMVQYQPPHRQRATAPQPSWHGDGYNAHASVPATPDSRHAAPSGYAMPPGWHCIKRDGGDSSANPSWQFCG
jgi:hypothetical protein